VDDAVDAFLLAGAADEPPSRLWNVGGYQALSLADIARTISAVAGAPPPVCRPFPAEHKGIDIGSYCSDSARIREELGWHPRIAFEEGVRRSLEYFQREFPHYLSAGDADCRRTLVSYR
jgi:nucleoside-diphosphate-sugar epimerase